MQENKNENLTLEKADKIIRKNKAKSGIIGLIFLLAIIVVGIYFCYINLFTLKNIKVVGDCPYSEEEMMTGMGLEKGMGIYDKTQKEIWEEVKYNLPFIDEIKISRRWPHTIVAKVQKATPTFYISISDDLYILSQSLRVLSKTRSAEDIELNSLIYLKLDNVFSCVEGEYLEISEENSKSLTQLVDILTLYGEFSNITVIDISDRFNMTLQYNSIYEVKLGDTKNLDVKIRFMQKILEKIASSGVNGIIDVSDEDAREATFKNF